MPKPSKRPAPDAQSRMVNAGKIDDLSGDRLRTVKDAIADGSAYIIPDTGEVVLQQSRENAISSRAVEGGAERIETFEQWQEAQRRWQDETADHASRMLQQARAGAVSHERPREGDTRKETAEADDPTDRPPLHQTGRQEMGDVPPKVLKPLKYRKTGPRSVEIVSNDTSKGEAQEQETQATGADVHPETGQITTTQAMGDVPPTAVSGDPAEPVEPHTHTRDLSPLAVTNRLRREGRWNEVEPIRDQMMRECKKRLPDKELRQAWVYSELDRMYPPVQVKPAVVDTGFVGTKGLREGLSDTYPKLPSSEGSDSGSIQGLEDMPKSWPAAPANASLPSEIAWVQANRLRIVEERPGKATLVRLDLALSPAPSWAALGWLETSIRSYAKFVDVAAKVSGGADDEGAVMRRERKSVEEVKALLKEMEEASDCCPTCGRPR
jgi:hypothetical protein